MASTENSKNKKSVSGFEGFFDKGWNLFKSMKFAIILLLIILVASVFNLFANEFIIPTGGDYEHAKITFERFYSPLKANLLIFFQMYNPYYSWWFTSLLAVLLLSLIVCLIDRTPGLLKKSFKPRYPSSVQAILEHPLHSEFKGKDILNISKEIIKRKGYSIHTIKNEGKTFMDASKNMWSHFGSWMLHVGFVLLIVGGAMIARGSYNVNVSGLPGEFLAHNDDMWGFNVRVDDFKIEYHPIQNRQYVEIDGNIIGQVVKKYEDKTFDIETFSPNRGFLQKVDAERISNRIDRRFQGSRLDQVNISDYLATLTIFENGQEIRTETIEVNKPLRHNGYRFYQSSFDDNRTDELGRWTTVINVRRDSGAPFVWAGILVVSLGLVLGMYFPPKRLNAIYYMEDENEVLLLSGKTSRNKSLFESHFEEIVTEIGKSTDAKG